MLHDMFEGQTPNGHEIKEKLSPQFRARLSHLAATSHVPVVVLLGSSGTISSGRRLSAQERQEAIDNFRGSATEALNAIDKLLSQFSGRRISEPNSLGIITVETTPAGIEALIELPQVKAVLEDQPLTSLAL
jgi:exopolyphosphatase/pppGpp-phosphohydrolase